MEKILEIIPAYNRAEVALRYYKQVYPERGYTKNQAAKQFIQDSSLDIPVLKGVVTDIYYEQIFKLEEL